MLESVEDSSEANKSGQLLDSMSREPNCLPRQGAPRDYIFEPQVVTCCKMGSDVCNIGTAVNSGLLTTDLVAVM